MKSLYWRRKARQPGSFLPPANRFGAVRLQPRPGLLGREPEGGVDAELARHLGDLGGDRCGRTQFWDVGEIRACHRLPPGRFGVTSA